MLISVLVFLLVLSILVLVHEFGHFITAVKSGIPVLEFGFGLPPRVFGKKIGNTIYSINLLPFGGFVRLFGENGDEDAQSIDQASRGRGMSKSLNERAFNNKPKRIRAMVVVAGVVMNFILAIFAFGVVYSFTGIPKETGKLKVVNVSAESPAQTGGLIVGDIIEKVGKENVNSVDGFVKSVEAQKGKSTVFEVERKVGENSSKLVLRMTPRETPPQGEGPLGVIITTKETYYPPIWQRPFYGIYYGFKEAVFWGNTVFTGIASMLVSLFAGHVPKDVSGPVGIFAVTSEVAKTGVLTLINFIGILSVNLAILNILPFPALDGGRLMFIGLEAIFGKRLIPKIESIVNSVGMAILLLLLLAITVYDIRRLIVAGSIPEFLNSMTK